MTTDLLTVDVSHGCFKLCSAVDRLLGGVERGALLQLVGEGNPISDT